MTGWTDPTHEATKNDLREEKRKETRNIMTMHTSVEYVLLLSLEYE